MEFYVHYLEPILTFGGITKVKKVVTMPLMENQDLSLIAKSNLHTIISTICTVPNQIFGLLDDIRLEHF